MWRNNAMNVKCSYSNETANEDYFYVRFEIEHSTIQLLLIYLIWMIHTRSILFNMYALCTL